MCSDGLDVFDTDLGLNEVDLEFKSVCILLPGWYDYRQVWYGNFGRILFWFMIQTLSQEVCQLSLNICYWQYHLSRNFHFYTVLFMLFSWANRVHSFLIFRASRHLNSLDSFSALRIFLQLVLSRSASVGILNCTHILLLHRLYHRKTEPPVSPSGLRRGLRR